MKYLAPASLFILNNEIMSLMALSIMALMFFWDIYKARCEL